MIRGLYVILDQTALGARDPVDVARAAIRGGATALQYRAKRLGDHRMFESCRRLARLCAKHRVPFLVNDRCDVALAVGASGVHLGHEDLPLSVARKILGPKKIIGVSSHSVHQALRLARGGPDYLALGPVFKSATKVTARKLLGPAAVRHVAKKVSCPVVAIGGINRHNAAALIEAGAGAVAVIAAVIGQGDVEGAARQMVRIADIRLRRNGTEGTRKI